MRAALAHNNEGVASASCSLLALHFELKLCSGVQPCAGALSMYIQNSCRATKFAREFLCNVAQVHGLLASLLRQPHCS